MSPFNINSKLTRRQMLQGTAALAATSFLSGCPTASPNFTLSASNPQPVPAGTITPASVAVTSGTAGSIPTQFAGLSYEKSTMWQNPALWSTLMNVTINAKAVPEPTNLLQLFQRIGGGYTSGVGLISGYGSVLRIGGPSVDQSAYYSTGAGMTANQIAPTDITNLANFAAACGWQVIYGINLAGSATGWTYPTAPGLAAAEATTVINAFSAAGALTPWFELGNEPDQYAATGGPYYGKTWTVQTFETIWLQYRTAILAAVPSAVILGPVSSTSGSAWTTSFASDSGMPGKYAALNQHYYRGAAASSSSTAANLITYPDTALQANLVALKNAATTAGVPFRISETNSYSGANTAGVSGVENAYASALWAVDHLFTCAQGGAAGINFHGGGSSINGFQPITDVSSLATGVRPEFYGIMLFNIATQIWLNQKTGTIAETGPFNILPVAVSASSLNVSAYAIQKGVGSTATGGINLVVVNKDLTNNLNLTVTLPQTVTSGQLLAMTQSTPNVVGPTLSATSGVTIGGDPVDGIPGTTIAISAYSITNNFVTFIAPNTLTAGEFVNLSGFTKSTFFNGALCQVYSANSSSFVVSFYNAYVPVALTIEAGTASLIAAGQVAPDGTFSPNSAYTLTPSGNQVTCYVPALSAVLIQLT